MKKIFNKLAGLWNIYGGIFISTLVAWLNDFSKGSMDTITSFIILTLTFVSVLTFLKISVFKKRTSVIDAGALSQKSIKAMKTAINPTETGEEIGMAIVETITLIKEKKKMEWLKKNKGAILTVLVGVLTGVGYICSTFNAEFGQLVIYKGFNIIGIVGGLATVLSGVLTSPITSVSLQTAIDEAKKTIKNNKVIEQKKETTIKAQVKHFEQKLDEEKAKLEAYENAISDYEISSRIKGFVMENETLVRYQEASQRIGQQKQNVANLEEAIKTLKEQL